MGVDEHDVIAGRYRVVRLLGGGGMGNVYEAVDTELGESVALKVLGGGITDDAVERFRREVRLTRKIRHANVARMFDIGEHRGQRFLTMELIDGAPLSRELGSPMPWIRLLPVAQQVCAGLAAAHAEGVIHRDLKPHNVLVERVTGRAVVTDFGIARSRDDVAVTQEGQVIGTPSYMAPEQLAGEPADARSDLFALGVMLFELATAKRPWPGKGVVELAQARATMPPRPFAGSDAPSAFVALVTRCLDLSPRQRPASAAEMLAVLEACETGTTTLMDARADEDETRPARPAAPRRGPTSIAVMPFTAAPDDAYLVEGMVEDLVDTLSTSPTLRVRPSRAAAAADPIAFGREVGVDVVVSGSVRRAAAGLRVTGRLTSVADGFQIWAKKTDTTDAAVLALADQLATEIAQAMSARAVGADRPTEARAVELFLRARAELRLFWGAHAAAAADMLGEAAAIAPRSAPILGAYAHAAAHAWMMAPRSEPAMLDRAHRALDAARRVGAAEAHLAAALLRANEGDVIGAFTEVREALARAPMSSHAHELAGWYLAELGVVEEARTHLETAVGLDANRILRCAVELSRLEMLEGNHAAALARLQPLLSDPQVQVRQVAAMNLLRYHGWMGQPHAMIDRVRELHPPTEESSTVLFALFARAAESGVLDEIGWRGIAVQLSSPPTPKRRAMFGLQLLAELAATFGRHDLAIDALERAVPTGLVDVAYLDRCPLFAHVDPARMAPLRADVAARASRALAAFRGAS